MTENKRFDCFENTWGSRTITDNGECIGAETAVDLLNQLNEENEQLKQEMRDLGTAHAEEINKIEDEFNEEILKLEKENGQLRQYKDAIFNWDSSKIIRVNKNTGKVDLVDKVMPND